MRRFALPMPVPRRPLVGLALACAAWAVWSAPPLALGVDRSAPSRTSTRPPPFLPRTLPDPLPRGFVDTPHPQGRRAVLRSAPGIRVVATPEGRLGVALSKGARGHGFQWEVVNGRAQTFALEGVASATRVSHLGHALAGQSHSALAWEEVLPGLRVEWAAVPGGIKSTFRAAAGFDWGALRLRYRGVDTLSRNADGTALTLTLSNGVVEERDLVAYQVHPTLGQLPKKAHYLAPSRTAEGWEYGIAVEGLDPSLPLVVDPTVGWESYLGGTGLDGALALAVDARKNLYVVGLTSSSDFPLLGAFDATGAATDAFVSKISALQATVLWSSFLGGTGTDEAYDVAVDAQEAVYVVGRTNSDDFPVLNAAQPTRAGNFDVFATKVAPNGGQLVWSTYLGGGGEELDVSIALEPGGGVALAGETAAATFPTTAGAFDTTANGEDCYVTRLSATGDAIVASTRLGGTADDGCTDVVVDGQGRLIVSGSSFSNDFPTTPGAYDPTPGLHDGFIARLPPQLNAFDWSTSIGGVGAEHIGQVALDATGRVSFVGFTQSFDFPIVNGFDSTLDGTSDVVVGQLSAAGDQLLWSTFLGGSGDEYPVCLSLDATGATLVSGTSDSTDFPATAGQRGATLGSTDIFFTRFGAPSPTVLLSGLYGSAGTESGCFLADSAGNVYLAGGTTTGFTLAGGFDTSFGGGGGDGVVGANLTDASPPLPGVVNDSLGADLDVQASTTEVAANWSGFTDPESGVHGHSWAVGTSPGAQDVRAFEDVGLSTSASATGVTLERGRAYYVTVRARNGFALTTDVVSDGFIVLGGSCTQGSDCATGFCAGGTCCLTACDEGCETCRASEGAPQDGVCGARPQGALCRSAASSCDAVESCTGAPGPCPADLAAPDASACGTGGACTGGTCRLPDGTVAPEGFLTTPPATASCLDAFRYAPTVSGGPWTFALVEAPEGMRLEPTTGRVEWTPGTAQGGGQPVRLQARAPGVAPLEQSFEVRVDCARAVLRVACGVSDGALPGWATLALWLWVTRRRRLPPYS